MAEQLVLVLVEEEPPAFANFVAGPNAEAIAALTRAASASGADTIAPPDSALAGGGDAIALWGARHPGQLDPVSEVLGWKIDAAAMKEIDRIVAQHVRTPLDPSFMAPPEQVAA